MRNLTRTAVLLAILPTVTPAQTLETIDGGLARADSLIRQHRYAAADAIVSGILAARPDHRAAALRKARLQIQAWQLDAAERTLAGIGGTPRIDEAYLAGRIALLRMQFERALAHAKSIQRRAPLRAEGYLLEGDAHFWNQQPELAEAPLRRAVELDSLNADARFAYGYAIWRRVDARQLPAMAEQWNRALEIDPLHYLTHWHFGNGHTHLTYADYAQPSDSAVRARLRGIDSLVARERVADALAATRALEREFPDALLPALARGSIFYMAYDMPRAQRLDSAQAAFTTLLARRRNYGPAHNGLAAVIKQRQLEYVVNRDSLEQAIAAEPLPVDSAFARVFKDLSYYPGDRVERMARQQLGPSLAYVPMLARLGYTYTVPPLHRDLDEALGRNFFRTSTTFDNRQWMDIRGAGGNHAAAGIEYVERGSHQERVVLLHEYVHQWHGAVLTDREARRIRELYHAAIANHRVLDYYSANNESEFFAQAYEAYLSPVKVHPLNHKAMNTRADLIRKDPVLFAFLDTLITRNRAYLAGDRSAMRSNWAHVYTALARQLRTTALRQGATELRDGEAAYGRGLALIDSALAHDDRYVPAMLEAARLAIARRQWAAAEAWLARAARTDSLHAPTLAVRAEYAGAVARERKQPAPPTEVFDLYERALALETDLAERARLNTTLRELYRDHGMPAEAIRIAEAQLAAPRPSTYLRDPQDEAAIFIAAIRSANGQAREQLEFFRELIARKPQQFRFRAQAALAMLEAGAPAEALRVIEEGNRILEAGRQKRADFVVLRAAALAELGRAVEARSVLAALSDEQRKALGEAERKWLLRIEK
ncbi:MAG: hypothetical protein ACT443_16005 [Gemmatimonadota bacterium]